MAVYRNRSPTSVPASLSISYLIGSPPTGTSMMTLTSCGGLIPIEMASMRMEGSVVESSCVSQYTAVIRGLDPPIHRTFKKRMDCRTLVGPGESDLVERLGPEFLRGARDHAAAERAIELRRRIVVGQSPDHHALQPALHEVAPCGGEEPSAEAETLEFRPQIEF